MYLQRDLALVLEIVGQVDRGHPAFTLLTLSPPTTGNVGFNFFIGPALGFKTGCNASFGQAGVRVSVDCDRSSV